ncbi:MAG: hypothetical protein FWG69_00710 [Oscillospiraceae bacterium]|nr:hypothetical protein [Oscillospiraceae bacterium]
MMKKRQIICISLVLALVLALLPSGGIAVAQMETTLQLDKSIYNSGEAITVTVAGVTPDMIADQAFVAIYEKDAAHELYTEWKRLQNENDTLFFAAPSAVGEYEMRLYNKDFITYADETLVTKVNFLVTVIGSGNNNETTLQLNKSTYNSGETITVTVSGVTPDMILAQAFVAIYGKNAAHSSYNEWKRLQNESDTLFFTAPSAAGEYEMRLYNQDFIYTDETFVTKVSFTVIGGGNNNNNNNNNNKQITITTAAKLPDATVGKPYRVNFATSDSLYRWLRAESILTGLYGSGLVFNPGGLSSTPSISGTPTKAGTIKIKFSPTNAPTATSRAPNAVVKEFTLTIKHARAAAETPKINRQPKGKTIRRNARHVLTVTSRVSGSGKLSFQWFRSNKKNGKFKKVSGKAGKKAVYLAPSKKTGTTWYRCTITNTDSSAKRQKTNRTSKTVKVTVKK